MVAAGAFAAYALTRTVGLPQDTGDIGNWGEPLGVVSLIAEGGFVLLTLATIPMWARRTGRGSV